VQQKGHHTHITPTCPATSPLPLHTLLRCRLLAVVPLHGPGERRAPLLAHRLAGAVVGRAGAAVAGGVTYATIFLTPAVFHLAAEEALGQVRVCCGVRPCHMAAGILWTLWMTRNGRVPR
jgi:hypothetical protein